MLSRLNLSTKLILQVVIILVCFSLVLVWIFFQFRARVYDEKMMATKHVVEVAYSLIAQYDESVKKGQVTLAEAQKLAIKDVQILRYAQKEYFWINDLTPRMIMHPFAPDLIGADLSDRKDPTGKRIFMEFVKVGKEQGAGMVEYQWPKAGQTKPVDKISYVTLYKPWGWIIGSGIYVDDVQKELAQISYIILGIIFLVVLGSFLLTYLVTRSITHPINECMDIARRVAAGETEMNIQSDAKDE
ncbi:MAG: hypothetical protein CVU74_06330, partial [Deltaproteobacteria bacterium HGW-Deltaproteobacteria-9]